LDQPPPSPGPRPTVPGVSPPRVAIIFSSALPILPKFAASPTQAAATNSDPPELCPRSDTVHSNSSLCPHNESAKPCLHIADKAAHNAHAPPSQDETRSLLLETPPLLLLPTGRSISSKYSEWR